MKKVICLTLSLMLVFAMSVTAFAAEITSSFPYDADALQAYCSSEEYTLSGLQERFPKFYSICQREYAQDAGQQAAMMDVKRNDVSVCSTTLGTYGDILVSLVIDSGSAGFAGHAAIVSDSRYETIESYAKSFSPIDKDGVQIYDNDWGSRSGSLLVRPYNATSDDYSEAVEFAETKIGLPYNWNFLDKNATDKYYCSQLVWQAWLDAVINIESGSIPNAIIAPADLVNSSNTYVVSHIT